RLPAALGFDCCRLSHCPESERRLASLRVIPFTECPRSLKARNTGSLPASLLLFQREIDHRLQADDQLRDVRCLRLRETLDRTDRTPQVFRRVARWSPPTTFLSSSEQHPYLSQARQKPLHRP